MKPAHIAVLTVRLLAFYIAVLAAMSAASLGFFLIKLPGSDDLQGSFALGAGISIALQCLLASVVYACAPQIARKFADEPSAGPIEDRLAFGQLALRIAGILIVESTARFVPALLETQSHRGTGFADPRMPYLALVITFVGLGVWLYLKAGPLARRLFATTAEQDTARSALAQAIGFSLLGAWLVVGVLPELLERLFARITSENSDYIGLTGLTRAGGSVGFVTELLRLALGLVLFFSAGVIARGWHKVRTAGLPRTNETERSRAVESEP